MNELNKEEEEDDESMEIQMNFTSVAGTGVNKEEKQ
jgi:hypothetical protein